jgi:type I restriction enzyme S subunit
MTRIRASDTAVVDPRWLANHLHYLWETGLFKALCRRHVNQASVSLARLRSVRFPLPTSEEQRAIAHVLRTVQKAIETTEQVIEATQELKRSLMKYLFTYGPVPVDEAERVPLKETEIGSVPEVWQTTRLAEVVEMRYGYSTPIPKAAPPHGIEIISTAEILNEGRLDLSRIRTVEIPQHLVERYLVAKNDILFNWRNAQKHVGKTAIVEDAPTKPTIFASFIIRLRTTNRLNYRYLHFLLTYLRQKGIFFQLSRRAVNQANFNANELGGLEISFPSLSVQEPIINTLLKVDQRIAVEEKRKQSLEVLFKSLLHNLMTGKVRVGDLDLYEVGELV